MKMAEISQTSRKVARNTIFLYIRMLLLMCIGLFTSRVVLNALGAEDYGTYNVVYSIVMMFTVISNSVSSAESRFLAYEIGKGDGGRLKKVFSGAVVIQILCSILLIILTETLGVWYLHNHTILPPGRENAAMWVLQFSMVLLIIQLFSIPFNCTIIAHEDMKAFAWISVLEGTLKLGVAFALFLTGGDKLILYSVLMALVALLVRGTYALFCRRHYPETTGRLETDWKLIGPMLSMSGWSATAYGIGTFNTHGINLLSNSAFGVGVNAGRGIASQVENIVRQFVNNFLTAINPVITKTYAKGDTDYCFAVVRKGCKFSYLIVLLFAIPFLFESDYLLTLWLGTVPEGASIFTKLVIFCVMADTMMNSLGQLIMANGKVRTYFILTSVISSCTFIGAWAAFKGGLPAESAYFITIAVTLILFIVRTVLANRLTGFPIRTFLKENVLPLMAVSLISILSTWAVHHFASLPDFWNMVVTVLACAISLCTSSFLLALTPGEREFVLKSFSLWKK